MASGPITSWEIDGETVSDFIFLGSKITADGDCSHEIKRHLILGRKVMTNLEINMGYGFTSEVFLFIVYLLILYNKHALWPTSEI